MVTHEISRTGTRRGHTGYLYTYLAIRVHVIVLAPSERRDQQFSAIRGCALHLVCKISFFIW